MSFLSRVFRSKDSNAAKKQAKQNAPEDTAPPKPQWTDPYLRTEVSPEEVQELLRGCTQELKSRGLSPSPFFFPSMVRSRLTGDAGNLGLDIPFLLLPFRPSSDPSAARTFIRNFFNAEQKGSPLRGEALSQELRLSEPMVGPMKTSPNATNGLTRLRWLGSM